MRKMWLSVGVGVVLGFASASLWAQPGRGEVPDAVAADPKHYSVSFENDVARFVRVRYGPGER